MTIFHAKFSFKIWSNYFLQLSYAIKVKKNFLTRFFILFFTSNNDNNKIIKSQLFHIPLSYFTGLRKTRKWLFGLCGLPIWSKDEFFSFMTLNFLWLGTYNKKILICKIEIYFTWRNEEEEQTFNRVFILETSKTRQDSNKKNSSRAIDPITSSFLYIS